MALLPGCYHSHVANELVWLAAVPRAQAAGPALGADLRAHENYAADHHASVAAARAGLPAARAGVAVAALPANPELRIGGEYGAAASTSDRNVTVVHFPVPNPMLVPLAVAVAEARVHAGNAAVLAVQWQVRRDVRLAWVQLQWALADQRLAQVGLDLQQSRAAWARSAAQAGALEPMISQQAALAWVDAQDRMARASEAIDLAKAQLAQATGSPHTFAPSDSDSLGACPMPPDVTASGSGADAVAGHPALAVWKARYAGADDSAALEHGMAIPWFKAVQVGTETMSYDGARSVRLAAYIEVPLFHWLGATNRQAEAERERFHSEYLATATALVQGRALALAQWRLAHSRWSRLQADVVPAVDAAVGAAERAVAARRWSAAVLFAAQERQLEAQVQLLDAARVCNQAAVSFGWFAGPAR